MPAVFDENGLEIPSLEEIQQESKDALLASFPGLNLSHESFDGQNIEAEADSIRACYELVLAIQAGIDPAQASGFQLRAISTITGTVAKAATYSIVPCSVTLAAGTYAVHTLIANVDGDSTKRFWNKAEVVSAGGLNTGVLFECQVTGPVSVNSGTLTEMAVSVAGWTTVTNTQGTDGSSATLGAVLEGDTPLRLRREAQLSKGGSRRVASIRGHLLDLEGVTSATLRSNNLDTEVDGQPGHSLQAFVRGGDDTEIATVIADGIAEGIQPYGNTVVTITDEQGVDVDVGFTRPVAVPFYVTVTLVGIAGTYVGDTAVKSALLAAWTNAPTARDVAFSQLYKTVINLAGVYQISALTLGLAPAPAGTSDLVMDSDEYASLVDLTHITVTSSTITAEP